MESENIYKLIIIINKNNKEVWIEHSCIPIFDEEGKFLGRRGNNRDITKRKKAQEALIRSESIQRKMVSNIGDVVTIIDKDGINRYKSTNLKNIISIISIIRIIIFYTATKCQYA